MYKTYIHVHVNVHTVPVVHISVYIQLHRSQGVYAGVDCGQYIGKNLWKNARVTQTMTQTVPINTYNT